MEEFLYIQGLGETYYETVIIEYDTPELFTLVSRRGDRYLAVIASSLIEVTLVPVSVETLKQIFTKKLTVREAFTKAELAYIVSLADGRAKRVQMSELICKSNNSTTYLPKEGLSLVYQNEDVLQFL